MKKFFKWISTLIPRIDLEDDSTRIHTQFIVVFLVLFVVSSFMTFLNYLTNWHRLGVLTFVLAIVNIISLITELFAKNRNLRLLGRVFFIVCVTVVFILFATTGEPEGFSILWSLLVPTCGFFLFGKKYGRVIGIGQLIVIVFLFYTSIGRSLLEYNYTESFLQRFPVLFISFMIVGYIFECIRSDTQKALVVSREKYEHLYNHDMLTGLYNRYGFNNSFKEFIDNRNGHHFAMAIIDIDHFKNVNDTYGHPAGDEVLKAIASKIENSVCSHCAVSRWGGEEFSVLFKCDHNVESQCNVLLNNCRNYTVKVNGNNINIYVSIGVVYIDKDQDADIEKVIKIADDNLYLAKQKGGNRVVYSKYEA